MKLKIKDWIFTNIIFKYFHEYIKVNVFIKIGKNEFNAPFNNNILQVRFPKMKRINFYSFTGNDINSDITYCTFGGSTDINEFGSNLDLEKLLKL